jgi:phage-related protein
MAEKQEWITEFYVGPNGERPVEGFLDSLDSMTRARFRWSMEQLRVRNIKAREPLVKHLEDKLWELREESSTNIYRIIYVFFKGRRIVFLHGFQKKTQKTPARELDIAKSRLADFVHRERERDK